MRAVCLALIGCQQRATTTGEQPTLHVTTKERTDATSDGEGSSTHNVIHLTHNFGLVRPKQSLRCPFLIPNRSHSTWTPARITNTCTCTVLEGNVAQIRSQESATFHVAYGSPPTCGDDERTVKVAFAEPGSPEVVMTITAQVRDELTVFPREVNFGDVPVGVTVDRLLEVSNFSNTDFDDVKVVCPEWCQSVVVPTTSRPHKEGAIAPRQSVAVHSVKLALRWDWEVDY